MFVMSFYCHLSICLSVCHISWNCLQIPTRDLKPHLTPTYVRRLLLSPASELDRDDLTDYQGLQTQLKRTSMTAPSGVSHWQAFICRGVLIERPPAATFAAKQDRDVLQITACHWTTVIQKCVFEGERAYMYNLVGQLWKKRVLN